MIPLHETSAGVSFAIKVHPRARKNAITGTIGEALKIAITAPPAEGRANEACIEHLAEVFGVSKSAVSIVSGRSTRNKLVRVLGISAPEAVRILSSFLT